MTLPKTLSTLAAVVLAAPAVLPAAPAAWPQFRGPNASGVAEQGCPPVRFGPQTNLRWKSAVPAGISAPIVWGDHVFLTGVENEKLLTLAFDARNGRELWRQVAPAEKIETCHAFSSPAA